MEIDIRSNIRDIERKLSNFAYRQVPFATDQAINALLVGIKKAEQANESAVLKDPTPFTLNSIGLVKTRKGYGEGSVFMKPIAEEYMSPFEFGGPHKLNAGNKMELVPLDKAILNGYGNIPRNFVRSMKARSDVFVGPVQTKNGVVYGVWQRVSGIDVKGKVKKVTKTTFKPAAKPGALTRVLRMGKKPAPPQKTVRKVAGVHLANRGLKLLIAFRPPGQVTQRLDWFNVAKTYVRKNFNREFGKALAKAVATAR